MEFIKERIASGEEPWKSAWEKLQASEIASLSYTPEATAKVVCGARTNPDLGSSEMSDDSSAVCTDALQWRLAGKQGHADRAIKKVVDQIGPEGTHNQHMPRGTLMFHGLPKAEQRQKQ